MVSLKNDNVSSRWVFVTILVLVCSIPLFLIAQKTNNVWAFGDHAGIDFNYSPPVAIDSTSIFNRERGPMTFASSICDKDGRLLFYTNGYTLWDRKSDGVFKYKGRWPWTFFVMPLFCPKPSNDSLIYLFGVSTEGDNAYQLQYVTLNKNGNGGNGEIVYPQPSTETNYYSVLLKNASLYLAGTNHCNNTDIWMVGHSGNSFYSYLVSKDGVNQTPVVSNIPSNVLPADKYVDINMKFSPNGEKLIIASVQFNKVLVFDFNNQTGTFSNPVVVDFPEGNFLADAEISPDASKLYVGTYTVGDEGEELHSIRQMDLNAGDADKIKKSSILLTKNPDRANYCSPHFCVFIKRTLELGPDGRIYISMSERTDRAMDLNCSLIEQPNEKGEACLYKRDSLNLKRKYKYIKNNYVRSGSFSLKENGIQFQKKLCATSPVHFSLIVNRIDSVKWDFGDIPSATNNFSTSKTPTHKYPGPGKYHVKAIIYTRCFKDTSFAEVTVTTDPEVHIPASVKDTTLCLGTSFMMDVTTPNALVYEWENGFNRPIQEITKPGLHSVRVANACSFDRRDFNIVFGKCECDVFVPTAFTPNGDQLNDMFRPIVKCDALQTDSYYSFKVFNRFGQVVFSTDRKEKGWTGLWHNEPALAGLYMWKVQFTNPNDKSSVYKDGTVTLIR